jgi:hypothetical protein
MSPTQRVRFGQLFSSHHSRLPGRRCPVPVQFGMSGFTAIFVGHPGMPFQPGRCLMSQGPGQRTGSKNGLSPTTVTRSMCRIAGA